LATGLHLSPACSGTHTRNSMKSKGFLSYRVADRLPIILIIRPSNSNLIKSKMARTSLRRFTPVRLRQLTSRIRRHAPRLVLLHPGGTPDCANSLQLRTKSQHFVDGKKSGYSSPTLRGWTTSNSSRPRRILRPRLRLAPFFVTIPVIPQPTAAAGKTRQRIA